MDEVVDLGDLGDAGWRASGEETRVPGKGDPYRSGDVGRVFSDFNGELALR